MQAFLSFSKPLERPVTDTQVRGSNFGVRLMKPDMTYITSSINVLSIEHAVSAVFVAVFCLVSFNVKRKKKFYTVTYCY